ncbi:MAG: nitroreductase family protein [Betaproteobacteria bacterium]
MRYPVVPLPGHRTFPAEQMIERASAIRETFSQRRTVRDFSTRAVDRRVIEECLLAAGTAPSGANLQPWRFVAITSADIKQKIRAAAEAEEREFYARRAPQEWKDALAPLGTDERKPFLESAPVLIAIFERKHSFLPDGRRVTSYYVTQSVGIATGLLIAAIHHAGLVSLTHTPSPMGFLNEICGLDSDHRPFLLLVVGHPAADATVPDIRRKPLDQIASFI